MSRQSIFLGCLWWTHKGSNLGPLPCEGNALPLSYASGIFVRRSKAANQRLAGRYTPSERAIYECGPPVSRLPAVIGRRWDGECRPTDRSFSQNAVLLKRINVISAVQSQFQKYSRSHLTQITSTSPAVPSHPQGAFRDRHGRGCGMRWTQAAH